MAQVIMEDTASIVLDETMNGSDNNGVCQSRAYF